MGLLQFKPYLGTSGIARGGQIDKFFFQGASQWCARASPFLEPSQAVGAKGRCNLQARVKFQKGVYPQCCKLVTGVARFDPGLGGGSPAGVWVYQAPVSSC